MLISIKWLIILVYNARNRTKKYNSEWIKGLMHVNIRESTNISINLQKSLNPLNPYIHNRMTFKIHDYEVKKKNPIIGCLNKVKHNQQVKNQNFPYENDDHKATSRKPLFAPNIKLDLLQFRRAISLKIHNTISQQKQKTPKP